VAKEAPPVETVEISEEVAEQAPVAHAAEGQAVAGESGPSGAITQETAEENLAAPVTELVTED